MAGDLVGWAVLDEALRTHLEKYYTYNLNPLIFAEQGMGQVTIYVDDAALGAVKIAAEQAHISISKWFAQFAEQEQARQQRERTAFWAEIDRLRAEEGDGIDLIDGSHQDLGQDAQRESF